MSRPVAVLATLDTKGPEAAFVCERLRTLGSEVLLVDVGVMGEPVGSADLSREQVASAGGRELAELRSEGTREAAAPVMVRGAIALLQERQERGALGGVLGFGGLQGTALCTEVMRALPYGVPKVMVSTVASGDTGAYVDIKDVTMMFSVGDILGLNALTRTILANAAGAVHGMAQVGVDLASEAGTRPMVGMTNLGVLTRGAIRATERFEAEGYEVVTFHAVGSGGRAMEQMMREGLLKGVFDYALGEISDALFGGLRAGPPERLTVAAELGLPQVICPGGAEHLGILVDPPHSIPERWKEHRHVFHNPVVFVPRLSAEELQQVAADIGKRLQGVRGDATLMIPAQGTGSYACPGGPLHDPDGDRAFFAALREHLPPTVEVVERDLEAEDPAFVDEAVERLVAMMRARAAAS